MSSRGKPPRRRLAPGEDSGPWTELEYDAFAGRVIKRELAADGSLETQRLYVGDEFEVTEHADGTTDYVSNLFLGQTQIARILRTEADGDVSAKTVEYLLSDQLGTPSVVASASGTALRSNSFTPYGAPETSDLEGPGFTGHRHDLESDLIDMRGRLYDPLIARFMSPDPIISDAHLSEGLNPYSYVFNSPMNWVDPSGFQADLGPSPSSGAEYGPESFQVDTINGSSGGSGSDTGWSSGPDTGMASDAPTWISGTPTMPPGAGVWSPGSGQTGDVVPSEDGGAASFESCPFGRCAGPPQSTNLSVLSEAARQVDNSADFWETALAIATMVTPGPGMGEGLIILSARAAKATRVAVTARAADAAGRGAGVGGGLPGLGDLPAGVAVPVRAGQALAIPRALTPREMAALMNTSGNIEFSQTFFQGQYFLTRASHAIPNQVQVLPLRSGVAWISHTHPVGFSGSASAADQAILKLLGQSASRVVRPNGSSVRFGP